MRLLSFDDRHANSRTIKVNSLGRLAQIDELRSDMTVEKKSNVARPSNGRVTQSYYISAIKGWYTADCKWNISRTPPRIQT